MQEHRYSLEELDSMMPWEREIYIALLKEHIEKKNEQIQSEQAKQRKMR